MIYIKMKWTHDFENEPILVYGEIGSDGYEVRAIDQYADGHFGFASESISRGGTELADDVIPSIEEISMLPGITAVRIAKMEFDHIWLAAIAQYKHDDPFHL